MLEIQNDVLFTGSERSIRDMNIIPTIIDRIGYVDLMISCLPKILRLNGLTMILMKVFAIHMNGV
jgi:hypothetical protein